jgi:hypothetical protein
LIEYPPGVENLSYGNSATAAKDRQGGAHRGSVALVGAITRGAAQVIAAAHAACSYAPAQPPTNTQITALTS